MRPPLHLISDNPHFNAPPNPSSRERCHIPSLPNNSVETLRFAAGISREGHRDGVRPARLAALARLA